MKTEIAEAEAVPADACSMVSSPALIVNVWRAGGPESQGQESRSACDSCTCERWLDEAPQRFQLGQPSPHDHLKTQRSESQ